MVFLYVSCCFVGVAEECLKHAFFIIVLKLLLKYIYFYHIIFRFSKLTLSGPYQIKISPLICRANQWTGFYMIGASVLKELVKSLLEWYFFSILSYFYIKAEHKNIYNVFMWFFDSNNVKIFIFMIGLLAIYIIFITSTFS